METLKLAETKHTKITISLILFFQKRNVLAVSRNVNVPHFRLF